MKIIVALSLIINCLAVIRLMADVVLSETIDGLTYGEYVKQWKMILKYKNLFQWHKNAKLLDAVYTEFKVSQEDYEASRNYILYSLLEVLIFTILAIAPIYLLTALLKHLYS